MIWERVDAQWTVTQLPDLGHSSAALAINESGEIIGVVTQVGSSIEQAVMWENVAGTWTLNLLGTVPGVPTNVRHRAYDINESTQIVGEAEDHPDNTFDLGSLWQMGNMYNLNDLFPPNSGWQVIDVGYGINDSGQIAGYGFNEDGYQRAYLMTPLR